MPSTAVQAPAVQAASTSLPPCPLPASIDERSAFIHATPDPELDTTATPPGITIVETKNVTNFETHAEGLANRHADLTFFQEHCATTATLSRLAHPFRTSHGRQLHYTGPDPNRCQPCAGVGVIALASDTCLSLEARCQRLASFIELGRAQLIAHGKGKA